ncbi:hypothetical protein D1AOALGA4SA_11542 [Olavius algarvensis Delta 1 endosymbiont]|nr:hypothetical protein D1AOALGA4SA_11542 [Olavius algarvensis Delta 1 endosymbiont]
MSLILILFLFRNYLNSSGLTLESILIHCPVTVIVRPATAPSLEKAFTKFEFGH